MKTYEAKLKKQDGIGFQTLSECDYYLVLDIEVYHTNPLTSGIVKGGKLSYKNCQAIELGYDLDELTEEMFNSSSKLVERKSDYIFGLRDGFKKALEILGDNKFSEEDMIKARNLGQRQGDILWDEFIKSKQETEWDVKILMKNNRTGKIINSDFDLDSDETELCDIAVPVLDSDGCLILKRK